MMPKMNFHELDGIGGKNYLSISYQWLGKISLKTIKLGQIMKKFQE